MHTLHRFILTALACAGAFTSLTTPASADPEPRGRPSLEDRRGPLDAPHEAGDLDEHTRRGGLRVWQTRIVGRDPRRLRLANGAVVTLSRRLDRRDLERAGDVLLLRRGARWSVWIPRRGVVRASLAHAPHERGDRARAFRVDLALLDGRAVLCDDGAVFVRTGRHGDGPDRGPRGGRGRGGGRGPHGHDHGDDHGGGADWSAGDRVLWVGNRLHDLRDGDVMRARRVR